MRTLPLSFVESSCDYYLLDGTIWKREQLGYVALVRESMLLKVFSTRVCHVSGPFWIIVYFLEAMGSLSLQQPCDMTFVPCPRPKSNLGSKPWFNHEIFVMVTKMKTNPLPSEKFLLHLPWELSKTSSRRVEEDVHKIESWSGTKFPMKKACLHKTKSQICRFFPKSPVGDSTLFAWWPFGILVMNSVKFFLLP